MPFTKPLCKKKDRDISATAKFIHCQILAHLANDSGEYKKIAGRVPSAAEKFSIACVTEEYLAVYKTALQEKRP